MGSRQSKKEDAPRRWQRSMERSELEVLEAAEVDVSKLYRTYTWIEMDGKPFGVRTHTYGSKTDGKKTLVLMHGYLGSCV